jgi:ABC-type proline/glycine betaine transport system ATPase subunit
MGKNLKINNEYYFFGPNNNIFTDESNDKISEKLDPILSNLTNENPKPICIIGYGQSGSGKTSSLIYFNKAKDDPDGIIMKLCNKKEISNRYDKISLKMCNLFVFLVMI